MTHCPCVALNHRHLPGGCDEPAPANPALSAVCATCRWWETTVLEGPHLTCSACDAVFPVDPHDNMGWHRGTTP